MKKLLLSAIVIVVGLRGFYYFSKPVENDALGSVTVIVENELNEVVYHQELLFEEEDTLFEIMDENLDIKCANASYQITDNCVKINAFGRVILGLESVETDWYNSYIAIYVNDEKSEYGIDGISLQDNTIYRFKYTSLGGDGE